MGDWDSLTTPLEIPVRVYTDDGTIAGTLTCTRTGARIRTEGKTYDGRNGGVRFSVVRPKDPLPLKVEERVVVRPMVRQQG
ncbi:MAG: hypothetical protein DRO87_09690 [Candidatus Thorarchaeota archaeon]|nr:MAG: hypothetical protein DRO87_09690 [Candidatus Thorarchaeota archaeon]